MARPATVPRLDVPASAGGSLRVGYVLKRFPRLTETFILNEILELERQGVDVEVYSLLRPPAEARHALLKSLRANVTYVPCTGAMEDWRIEVGSGTGAPVERGVVGILAERGPPFADLFAGKTADRVCRLCLAATTIAALASQRGVGHLHAHFGSDTTSVALLAGRLSRLPFSFTAHARDIYHTYVNPTVDDALRRRKIAEAAFVVTVSDYNLRHLVDLAGPASGAKIHRLYNGIDLNRIRPPAAKRDPDLFLGVGRLVEKKGFADLIEACRLLRDRGACFRCVIVGDGPLRTGLDQQIAEAGLTQVHLLGALPQEEVLEIMASATALVLPCVVTPSGDRDGLPTVLSEALAAGLPAISTRVSGGPEVVEHERTGLVVAPHDPLALAAAMQDLLAAPAMRRRMGAAGREKAERDFDLGRNVAMLRALFRDAVGGGSMGLRAAG